MVVHNGGGHNGGVKMVVKEYFRLRFQILTAAARLGANGLSEVNFPAQRILCPCRRAAIQQWCFG